MKLKNFVLFGVILLFTSFSANAVVIETEDSPGVYVRAKSTSGVLQVVTTNAPIAAIDPCQSSAVEKFSAVINIIAAGTNTVVALTGGQIVYVCAFSFTISQVITTANTLKFIEGTGAACATGPLNLSGLYGAGGITAAPPIVIESSGGGTLFKTGSSGGLCAVTVIGATGSFQGVLTYVKQ